MGRYGIDLYGSCLYGSSIQYGELVWGLDIDWDDDGSFDGNNEAGKLVALSLRRGREFFIKSDGSGFEPVLVGEITLILLNLNGRYDPYNQSSPLYPNVLPGKRFRLRVRRGSTIYPVITGRISSIQPVQESGIEKVVIEGVDGIAFLLKGKISGSMQVDKRIDDALQDVLDAAGWSDPVSIGNISDIIPYWWASGQSAMSEIDELTEAALANFFIAADGTATAYSRTQIPDAIKETLNSQQIRRDISLPQPWEVVRNAVNIVVNPLQAQATADIFTLGEKPVVAAGASVTIWAGFMFNNESVSAVNVIAPVPTTDYLMNTASDGSGTNLTAQFTVTASLFSETAKLVIKNNSAQPGYITYLRIRGDALVPSSITVSDEDETSIGIYGRSELTIDNRWVQSISQGLDYSTVLVTMLKDAQKFPVVTLRSQPDLQFAPDLFDWVTLAVPSRGINSTFAVGHIEHSWMTPRGDLVETRFRFEPIMRIPGVFWVFPTQLGVTSILGY